MVALVPQVTPPNIGPNSTKYELHVVWPSVIVFVILHAASLYALYLAWYEMKILTCLWIYVGVLCSVMGVTAGAHRLWSHQSYKAKLPLRIILMIFHTVAFQKSIFVWARDHRVHHKFTDTNADPHNSRRGFFFAHIGWLMVRKHPDVAKKGKLIDIRDLKNDPVVMLQRKYYMLLMPIFSILIPTLVPCYFWNESPMLAFYATIFRYTLCLHMAWTINSIAHMYGSKPYDNSISPTDTVVLGVFACGDGWHNYHHVFPWDYKAAELGNLRYNLTTAFIDVFASIGWAYDLKTVSTKMIEKRAARTGDGTRIQKVHDRNDKHSYEEPIWGWGDNDMLMEDIKDVHMINKGQ